MAIRAEDCIGGDCSEAPGSSFSISHSQRCFTEKRALRVPYAKTLCDVLLRFVPGTCQLVNKLLPLCSFKLTNSGDQLLLRAIAGTLCSFVLSTLQYISIIFILFYFYNIVINKINIS